MADFSLSDAIKEAAMKEGVPVTEVVMETTTAVLNIAPGQDERVVALQNEVMGLLSFAQTRVIVTDQDVAIATDDLSLMAKLKKAIEEKRREYVDPLNAHLKDINEKFKLLSDPLAQADKTTREKVLTYRAEVERKRREIEEINRQAEELARKQASLNNGEFTVDTTPVVAPAAPPAHVRTEAGTLGTQKVRKWEIIDIKLVPDDYKIIDSGRVNKVVKAGIPSIPGIRIWEEDTLRVTTK